MCGNVTCSLQICCNAAVQAYAYLQSCNTSLASRTKSVKLKTVVSRPMHWRRGKRQLKLLPVQCIAMPCPFPFLKHMQTYKTYMSSMQMQADLFGSTAQTSRAGVSLHGHEKLAQHRSPASFSTGRCCFLSWRNCDQNFRKTSQKRH